MKLEGVTGRGEKISRTRSGRRGLPPWLPILLICSAGVASVASGCRSTTTPDRGSPVHSLQPSGRAVQTPGFRAEDLDPKPLTPPSSSISGERAFQTLKEFVALGPRFPGSAGHAKAEQFILDRLRAAGASSIEENRFTAQTPAGAFPINNILAKFPGGKDGIIVIAGHYDTNYSLRDTRYVGANDGGSSVAVILEIAKQLGAHPPQGYSIWLLFTDGEEAFVQWSATDGLYGSKHLAAQWSRNGTAGRIKAFLLLDMIGDKQLGTERDTNSTPWLVEVVGRAAQRLGTESHFFVRPNTVLDDHLPFAAAGIPAVDLIDLDYGFDNIYHHTTEDTPDKCSAASLRIAGDVVMETIRALNTR